ncbi:MAG: hypothetical protein LBE91_15785 [Tannerella sp.]|jgi:hypothetical protein|nr:hypothetical protein [Tannerella sp.]
MEVKNKKTTQKDVASKENKPKLTQWKKQQLIKELSKEVNRNISRRMLMDLIGT